MTESNNNLQFLFHDKKNIVTVVNGKYTFNGKNYNQFNYIVVHSKIYELNIPQAHPIGFIINDNSKFEVISGTEYGEKVIENINVKYYYGDVRINIKNDFNEISYNCYIHGYMGGQNRLKFKTKKRKRKDSISDSININYKNDFITTMDLSDKNVKKNTYRDKLRFLKRDDPKLNGNTLNDKNNNYKKTIKSIMEDLFDDDDNDENEEKFLKYEYENNKFQRIFLKKHLKDRNQRKNIPISEKFYTPELDIDDEDNNEIENEEIYWERSIENVGDIGRRLVKKNNGVFDLYYLYYDSNGNETNEEKVISDAIADLREYIVNNFKYKFGSVEEEYIETDTTTTDNTQTTTTNNTQSTTNNVVSSSAGADPYINPIYGPTYKLPDNDDVYRFLDNNLNKRFLINIKCWNLPKIEKTKLNLFIKQKLSKLYNLKNELEIKNWLKNKHIKIPNSATFIRYLLIHNLNQNLIFDLELFKFITNNGEIKDIEDLNKNFIINKDFNKIKLNLNIDLYNNLKADKSIQIITNNISYGKIIITLFKYNNPQIRNGINILTEKSITKYNSRGALLGQQNIDDILINNINSIDKINKFNLITHKNQTKELFLNNSGDIKIHSF